MPLRNLKERDVISQQRLDEARLQVTISEAEYNSAREKLRLLKKGARKEDRDALLAQIRQAEADANAALEAAIAAERYLSEHFPPPTGPSEK